MFLICIDSARSQLQTKHIIYIFLLIM